MKQIENGKVFPINTNGLTFLDRVKEEFPIAFGIKLVFVDVETGRAVPRGKLFDVPLDYTEGDYIHTFSPAIRVTLFPSNAIDVKIVKIFGQNMDVIIVDILDDTSNKIMNLVFKDQYLPLNSEYESYEELDESMFKLYDFEYVESIEDLKNFITKTEMNISSFFDLLNYKQKEFENVIKETYEKLGLLAHRASAINKIKNQNEFIDIGDGKFMGILKSKFATSYFFIRGL